MRSFWLGCCFLYGRGTVGATMKTAITIWNARVSPVFDVAGKAMLYHSEGEIICSEQQLLLADAGATGKVACLVKAGTDVLICGAISRDTLLTATDVGIRVYSFIAGDVLEILQACLDGRLVDGGFAMPGCDGRMVCSGKCKYSLERAQITGSAQI